MTQITHAIRLTNGFRERLSAPMPKDAIKPHPSKSYLSTIKAIYIIERLNDVFGICGWDFEHEVVGQFTNGEGDKVQPYILIKGRIYVREFDLYTPYQYGGHEINGKGTEPADGFKSAVTDAISKCASFLEIGIQVFKGNPSSSERNVTKRLDAPVEQTEVMAEKKVVHDDPVIAKRIAEMNTVSPAELAEAKPELMAKKTRTRIPKTAEIPVAESNVKEIIDDMLPLDQREKLEEATEPVAVESEIEKYRKAVMTYLDSNTLKAEAKDILFTADRKSV